MAVAVEAVPTVGAAAIAKPRFNQQKSPGGPHLRRPFDANVGSHAMEISGELFLILQPPLLFFCTKKRPAFRAAFLTAVPRF